MNVEMLEELRTHEPENMAEVARALGQHLAITPDRNFRSFRTAAKRTVGPGDDPFAIGFVAALEMMLRGFEAQREADDDDAAAIETASHNPARAALEVIAARHAVLPSELAKDLKLKPNHITAVLGRLEAAKLVSQLGRANDLRKRPRSITPYGRIILQKTTTVSSGPIKDVVMAVVRAMANLEDGHASERQLKRVFDACLGARHAPAALRAFRDAMAATYIGFLEDDATFLMPGNEVRRQLQELVSDATQRDDAPLAVKLRALSRDRMLIVRASNADYGWDRVVHARKLSPRVMVVLDNELASDRVRNVQPPFGVLYSSPKVLSSDDQSPDAGPLKSASMRYLLGDRGLSTLTLPPRTQLLSIGKGEMHVHP